MTAEFGSLLVIATIAAFVPLLVGLLRIKVAEVVLLLGAGVLFGPQLLGLIHVDESITLLSELGLGMLFFPAGLTALVLQATGVIVDGLGVAIALTSTALGTLLPVLRDAGELNTRFGTFFMGAGAWGEFGPIIAISVLLGTKSSFVALLSLAGFAVLAMVMAVLPARLAGDRVREVMERGNRTSSQTALRFTMLLLIALLALAGRFGLDVVLGAFVAGIIVAVTTLEVGEGVMDPRNAAALVGAGALSVLVFPLLGNRIAGRPPDEPVDQERAENTA